jgi:hypothetical protein
MKYTIKWCEVKKEGETNGRKWKITEMTLVDEEGKEVEGNVSTFDSVLNGDTIDGEIVDGKYGKEFKAIKETKGGAYKEKMIEKAQETKANYIAKAQGAKEDAIMWSSCFRDATLITIAQNQGQKLSDRDFKDEWEGWRKWLLERFNDDIKDVINPF